MKIGMIGRLFPALFGKAVYEYTAKALPDIDRIMEPVVRTCVPHDRSEMFSFHGKIT